ncbi:MAG: M56 family metallopeptidase [Planctomycetaceae bacterium]
MHLILEFLLTNAVAAAMLAIGVWLISHLIRRPAVVHAFWVLVLIKLITPSLSNLPVGFSVDRSVLWDSTAVEPAETQISSGNADADRPQEACATTELPGIADRSSPRNTSTGALIVCEDQPAFVAVDSHVNSASQMPFSTAGVIRFAVVIWWGVSAILLLGMIRNYVRFRRHLSQHAEVNTDVIGESFDLAWRMGIRRPPQVRVLTGTMSPMLYGLGSRVTMVLPHELLRRLAPQSRATLIAHELAHFRRGDCWVRLLEAIVTVIFWWHPVVWFARRQIESAEEECCDAWVMSMFPSVPRQYAEALLDTIDFLNERPVLLPPLACGLGPAALLRRRLTLIMKGVAPKTAGAPGILLLIILSSVALSCQPLIFRTQAAADVRSLVTSVPADFGTDLFDANPGGSQPDVDERNVRDPADFTPAVPGSKIQAANSADNSPLTAPTWVSAVSRDGQTTLLVREDRSVILTTRTTGQPHDIPADWVRCAAFSSDGRQVAVGGRDGVMRILDSATSELLVERRLTDESATISSLDWSHDGSTILAASDDGHLWLLSAEDASVQRTTDRTALHINCVRFSTDDRTIAFTTGHWSQSDQATLTLLDASDLSVQRQAISRRPLGAVVFSQRSNRLLVLEWNGRATVVEADLSDPTAVLPAAKDDVSSIAFSADAVVAEILAETF